MNRPKNVWGIILAAGSGTRLAEASGGVAKQYLAYKGAPLFWHSARVFARVAGVRGLVFVFPPSDVQDMAKQVELFCRAEDLGLDRRITAGGERRQDSVLNGLDQLPAECDAVLVHDAARPFVTARLIHSLLDGLEHACGVIPALEVTDTVKRVSGQAVAETLVRSELRAVQTPQAFETKVLKEAHRKALEEGWDVTDDASMVEHLAEVIVVPGEPGNIKITTPADLAALAEPVPAPVPCVGWGYDVHRFGGDRPLVLGGVPIQGGPTVQAHSDGDVLLHALMDALLGLIGGGDIGTHFPDTDAAFDNASSGMLTKEVLAMVREAGVRIVNADLTVITQIPRLAPWAAQITANVLRLLELSPGQVNVKATTEEGLGFTGEKKGIKAVAVVTGMRG